MTPISAFIPFVALKVAKDMPLANIEHALREALVFFMEQTRSAIAEYFVTQGRKDYEVYIDLPTCRRLVGVTGVYLVPQAQCGVTEGQLRWRPDWEQLPFSNYEGQPGWSVDDADGDLTTLWVSPTAPEDRRLCIRYAWTPKRDATCEVPDWLFERYADAIADGALAYLHANPADESASAPFSTITSRAFRAAIDESKARHIASRFGPRELRVSAAHFFMG